MTFHRCTVCACIVIPNPDSVVAGNRGDQSTLWIDRDIAHWTLVTNELVWSGIGTETPCEDGTIVGAGKHLLQVWMEQYIINLLFVTLQYFQKTRIVW